MRENTGIGRMKALVSRRKTAHCPSVGFRAPAMERMLAEVMAKVSGRWRRVFGVPRDGHKAILRIAVIWSEKTQKNLLPPKSQQLRCPLYQS